MFGPVDARNGARAELAAAGGTVRGREGRIACGIETPWERIGGRYDTRMRDGRESLGGLATRDSRFVIRALVGSSAAITGVTYIVAAVTGVTYIQVRP